MVSKGFTLETWLWWLSLLELKTVQAVAQDERAMEHIGIDAL